MSKLLRLVLPAAALAATGLHSGAAEAGPRVVLHIGTPVVHVQAPPPKVWVPGHHEMRAGRKVWVSGSYRVAPRPHAAWINGHWEKRGRKQVWVPGHWR